MNQGVDIPVFGSGDMTRAVYDVNNNGIVDAAELVPGCFLFVTGSYTGDGSTNKLIDTGLGDVRILEVWIFQRSTADNVVVNPIYSNEAIIDDNALGMAVQANNGGAWRTRRERIRALNSNGTFTIGDAGNNQHPNRSGQTYNYRAIAVKV